MLSSLLDDYIAAAIFFSSMMMMIMRCFAAFFISLIQLRDDFAA